MKLSADKVSHMTKLANERGVIAAAAMDQRGSLKKSLSAARGGPVTTEDMEEFKSLVSEVLTPHASAILLDPEYGLPAAERRAPNAGLLLAYEESGYDNTQPGRLPDLLPHESAARIRRAGANAVKVLIYYSPFERPEINDVKHAFIERIGAECVAEDIPFFLEFVGYDPDGGDEKGIDFARRKPDVVIGSMKEFAQDRYHVDVLKVEIPVNMRYVEGSAVAGGESAYSKSEAMDHFRSAAGVARQPFIYLSAGVSNAEFTSSLELAAEAGVKFNGVLCGRATWKDGIPVYAERGAEAFRQWLQGDGIRNIEAVNERLKAASPWYGAYGASSTAELTT
jgi:tagatose 1,6-diphosphate aldolase